MKQNLISFFEALGKILLSTFKYLFVSVLVMMATLSLATGKFPPPIKSLYQSLKSFHGNLDLGNATVAMATAGKQQQEVLEKIDQAGSPGTSGGEAGPVALSNLQQNIKTLEYEVALLKSKLHRSEAEARDLKARLDATSVLPTSEASNK